MTNGEEINYRKVFARKKRNEDRIKKFCPNIKQTSGIYWFYREDENNIKYGYIGKAEKNILTRMSDHFSGYQHIDLSIKKWGMYSKDKNPYGYKCGIVCYCKPSECDEKEQFYIKQWANQGVQLRNIQSGGSLGRTNIADNKPSKGYYDGIKRGEDKTRSQIKVFFDKYLDYSIKGKPTKIKERKMQEFADFLADKTKAEEDGE